MRVPSRSRKTAGNVSLDETVILKTGEQFLLRDGGGPEFADDNGASMVGDLGRFGRCCVTTERERKHGDRGVACAGDIENLPSLCRNIMRLIPFLKKHHSLFTQGDQKK